MISSQASDPSTAALKAFLRDRRARIPPEGLGLPTRRAVRRLGLRCDDVAELLNVSSRWYGLFESGTSGRRFSGPFLNRVADVLQLDDSDRDLLFRLVTASGAAANDVAYDWNQRRGRVFIAEIAETSRRLATAPDPLTAIALACEHFLALFRSASPCVTLVLDGREGIELVHYAARANPHRVSVANEFATVTFQDVLSIGSSLVIQNVDDHTPLARAFRAIELCIGGNAHGPTRSAMFLPIIATARRLGVFCVTSPFSNAFTELEAEIALTMAAQLGRALDTAPANVERRAPLPRAATADRPPVVL